MLDLFMPSYSNQENLCASESGAVTRQSRKLLGMQKCAMYEEVLILSILLNLPYLINKKHEKLFQPVVILFYED